MNLAAFHQEYALLLPKALRELGKVSLVVDRFTDPDEVEAKIAEWGPSQGWISRQSEVQVFSGPVVMDEQAGYIIAAELSRANGALHIRQKAGGWIVTEAVEGSGEDALIERLTYIADPNRMSEDMGLRYHRYWVIEEDRPKQLFAAFQGFVPLTGEHQE